MARLSAAPTGPAASGPAPPTHWPLSNRAQIIAGIVMALSNFMVVLDLTIANVSVPHIAGNLGISLDQGTWIITSYAVAEAICVPLTGWLADRFGSVRVFTVGMMSFGLFSLLCGLSPTLGVLVAARIGQGVCGAPLMPMTQALMLRVFPPERRAGAMALWSITVMLAPAMGPIVGGYISDNYSWHWIFLINVPIALACTAIGGRVLRPVETERTRKPIDKIGLALLVFWIGCLQLMLDLGRDRDWFADTFIVMLALGAGIGFLAFIIWELTDEHPIVDLRIFRHRTYAIAVVILSTCFASYFASVVIIPQWLQSTQGYTAQDAGMVTAWTAATSLIAAIFLPRVIGKVDLRLLIAGGTIWFVIQSLVRTRWTSGMDFWSLSMPQIVQGFGMPFFIITATQMSLGAVEPREVPSAAGLQNFLRTMGIAVVTSLVLNDWSNQQRIKQNGFADVLQPDATLRTLADAGVTGETARAIIGNVVNEQAMTLAMDHTFYLGAIVGVIALGLVWLSPRPQIAMRGDSGAH